MSSSVIGVIEVGHRGRLVHSDGLGEFRALLVNDLGEETTMRHRGWGLVAAGLAGLLFAGCEGDTSSRGFVSVTITDEEEESVVGNLCAVKGNATNSGNRRARVRITWEAKNGQGTVIGTSSADFEVAGFSNFQFSFTKGNSQGQPSSGVFSNGLSCAAIADFDRKDLDVDAL